MIKFALGLKLVRFFPDSGLQKEECIFSILLMRHKFWNSLIKRR